MRLLATCLLVMALPNWVSGSQGVADTAHNLSVSGPGEIRSQVEDRVCIFCHTPHNSNPDAPMWNRRSTGYTQYQLRNESPSDTVGPSSALCLSCHDGTIALGELFSSPRNNQRQANDLRDVRLKGRSNIGTDLTDDHPVGIEYRDNSSGRSKGLLHSASVDLPLDGNRIECNSCHDPHSSANPPFLVKSSTNGELCLACHQQSGSNWRWETSSHAVSMASPRGADPWAERKEAWKGRNVAENACMNCHAPHNARVAANLVKDEEENACLSCHDGTLSANNINADKRKFFRHSVDITPSPGHENAESENPYAMTFHVECEDCHNPHASRSDEPMISFNPSAPFQSAQLRAPFVNGVLAGVSGIDENGNFTPEADYQFEVCFKCHGVPGKSACDNRRCDTASNYDMERQDRSYNLRDKTIPSNPRLVSWHPIATNNPANNAEVPSLRNDTPLDRSNSRIYCTDCHSSDFSPAAGGSGASGPHGSRFEGLMALDYEFDPDSVFAPGASSLCFKCHEQSSLYNDDSFLHRKHVLDAGKSCINCHDPHGSGVYPHLINFLTRADVGGNTYRIRGYGGYTTPTWRDDGMYSGTCWLSCHGVPHDGAAYGPAVTKPELTPSRRNP